MRRFKLSIIAHIFAISNILNFEDKIVDKAIQFIESSNNLYLTGIGKNADLMYKISKTFNSVSIKCQFIDPVNAIHGDIGNIPKGSSIIASSKSGTTEELTKFLSYIHGLNEDHKILMIHCNDNLNLDYVHDSIYIPVFNEADHLNIVPTVSLCSIEVFLHSVLCEIIEKNNFSKYDMLRNHPAGNLGKICNEK